MVDTGNLGDRRRQRIDDQPYSGNPRPGWHEEDRDGDRLQIEVGQHPLHPDRLARDTGDLLTIGKRVIEKKAVLRIDDPNIVFDGTDMMAEVMLTILGMVGMMEKHFIKARQRRGIEAARLKGVYKGRPATISRDAVQELRQQGLGATQIAKRLGIGRASVYRALAV